MMQMRLNIGDIICEMPLGRTVMICLCWKIKAFNGVKHTGKNFLSKLKKGGK